jgi:hypothetical protein
MGHFMKMNKKLLVLGATFALAAQFGTNAMAAQDTGDVVALLVEPLTITSGPDMDFGTIAGGTGVGTVVMDLTGGLTTTGDAQIIGVSGGTAGTFNISGEGSLAITVSVPVSAVLEGPGSPGTDMTITFNSNAATTTALSSGVATLTVFGSLALAASQPAGSYTTAGGNSYVVTVNYD